MPDNLPTNGNYTRCNAFLSKKFRLELKKDLSSTENDQQTIVVC